MKHILFSLFLIAFQALSFSQDTLGIPAKNKEVLDFVRLKGREISPTYPSAVCTELVIGVLNHFVELNSEDKSRIRIITTDDVFQLIKDSSDVPKGVYYALITKGSGLPIAKLDEVKPGDFVQFWYESWGHCGIVESVDFLTNKMKLHSSFPSTNGYGIQEFDIPSFCFFVRLK